MSVNNDALQIAIQVIKDETNANTEAIIASNISFHTATASSTV